MNIKDVKDVKELQNYIFGLQMQMEDLQIENCHLMDENAKLKNKLNEIKSIVS